MANKMITAAMDRHQSSPLPPHPSVIPFSSQSFSIIDPLLAAKMAKPMQCGGRARSGSESTYTTTTTTGGATTASTTITISDKTTDPATTPLVTYGDHVVFACPSNNCDARVRQALQACQSALRENAKALGTSQPSSSSSSSSYGY